jgi:hypothetical protein
MHERDLEKRDLMKLYTRGKRYHDERYWADDKPGLTCIDKLSDIHLPDWLWTEEAPHKGSIKLAVVADNSLITEDVVSQCNHDPTFYCNPWRWRSDECEGWHYPVKDCVREAIEELNAKPTFVTVVIEQYFKGRLEEASARVYKLNDTVKKVRDNISKSDPSTYCCGVTPVPDKCIYTRHWWGSFYSGVVKGTKREVEAWCKELKKHYLPADYETKTEICKGLQTDTWYARYYRKGCRD